MAADSFHPWSRSTRCCSCMKNGRCVRCNCVKKGLPCVDCWPSLTNPVRCQNLAQNSTASSSDEHLDHLGPSHADTPDNNSTNDSVDSMSMDVQRLVEFVNHRKAVLRRIPRLSRITVARKLACIIDQVILRNDFASWCRLLQFPKKCLFSPKRGGRRWKLASIVNNQVSQETMHSNYLPSARDVRAKSGKPRNTIEAIAVRVSGKLEEADYRGAVRLVSSEDVIADHCVSTLEALKKKHPPPHKDSSMPNVVSGKSLSFSIDAAFISKAIMSFPNGSSGGCDGLRPQHLKDLTGPSAGDGGVLLLKALEGLLTLILEGRTPSEIQPILFGASLTPLKKKSGGIRPIAVGCTFRRLASKCAVIHALDSIPELMVPHQLGFGVPGGVEAAVHACRVYLNHLPPEKAVLKVDFENAFNSIRRDKILLAVQKHIPDLLPFVNSAYSSPSILQWDNIQLASTEGIQQGDPIGPLLFCITMHP